MTIDLVVAGKLAIDELSFEGTPYTPVLGGSAAHVAIAAATLGSKVSLVSTIGNDFPPIFLQMLESKGIDLSGVRQLPGRSAHFWADFTKNGKMNSYKLHFGVGNQLSLGSFSNRTKNAQAVHLGILPPHLQRALIKRVQGKNKLLSMTTIFHQAKALRNEIMLQIPFLDILFLNSVEAMLLTQLDNPKMAIEHLGELVPIVVVTIGSDGCLVNHQGKVKHVVSYHSNEVDVTGAGDSFAGAFLASYLQDNDIIQAAKWGNAAGAINVQGVGCTSLLKAKRNDLEQLVFSTK
ncbi:MAG: carbohydrate kinase family protein [Promethearchaeota archaeon]